ncbi:MAG: hypothetical protein EOP39_17500 [Rubrivivax sp.]|nr:MAG: hypothetical protein EOP39_17500 [Rubrivivax sp.]
MHHRWLARGFVVALHAAALLALWLHRPPRMDDHGERRYATVRLIEPVRRTPPPIERPRVVAEPRLTPPLVRPPVLSPDTAAPDETPAAPPAAAPMPASTEPPRTTLRLTLPPSYAASANARRNPALDDPRSNTARSTTLEDRIGDATGGAGAWVEEPVENHAQVIGAVGEHRTVLRKGDTCMEVFRSRISDSDPFNNSVAPRTVAMMGKSYTCKNTKSRR